ncbi:TPA: Ig-like domain-containing protein [Vibrio diabolicus]|uniref:Ig-like domain-containing protein n=1 Tax=Vibrio diabolicus TaxID=50719 RepID=UPI0020CDBD55|nr:Ig-like domain-containing protein [Vibrio diabolicus]
MKKVDVRNYLVGFITIILLSINMSFGESILNNDKVNQYTPQINGVLTKKGKPINNQKVSLSIGLSASGKSIDLSTFTDSNGRFEFSPVYENKESVKIPLIEHYVTIVLTTELDIDESVIIWEGSFDGYEIEDYVKNNMANLVCDAANPLKYFAFSIDDDENDDYYVNSQCDLFGYIDSDLYGN